MTRDQRIDTIIAAMKLHPGNTSRELAAVMDWTHKAASALLGQLHDYGMVRRENIAPQSTPTGSRVEYRYWFKPKAPVEAKQPEAVR